ncbi:hypothetical protein T4B_15036, partial [Trichinella pseudospiralis]
LYTKVIEKAGVSNFYDEMNLCNSFLKAFETEQNFIRIEENFNLKDSGYSFWKAQSVSVLADFQSNKALVFFLMRITLSIRNSNYKGPLSRMRIGSDNRFN